MNKRQASALMLVALMLGIISGLRIGDLLTNQPSDPVWKRAQIDAASGKWHWHLVNTPDGSREWQYVDPPATQPR